MKEMIISVKEQMEGDAFPEYAVAVLMWTLLMNAADESRHPELILDQAVKHLSIFFVSFYFKH